MATLKVKSWHESQGDHVIIDEEDFNPEFHQLHEDEKTEEKAKYRKSFDKVVDIIFAPEKLAEGDKKFEKPKAKAKDE